MVVFDRFINDIKDSKVIGFKKSYKGEKGRNSLERILNGLMKNHLKKGFIHTCLKLAFKIHLQKTKNYFPTLIKTLKEDQDML